MKIKKNIDTFFKERLQDFEATPSPEVWENIQSKIKKEEDRKTILIWWKLGGIAALLALLLTIGGVLINPNFLNTNAISTEEKTGVPLKKKNSSTTEKPNTQNSIASEEKNNSLNNSHLDSNYITSTITKEKETTPLSIQNKNKNRFISPNNTQRKNSFTKRKELSDNQTIIAKKYIKKEEIPTAQETSIKKDLNEFNNKNENTGIFAATQKNKPSTTTESKTQENKTTGKLNGFIEKNISDIIENKKADKLVAQEKTTNIEEKETSNKAKKSIFDAIQEDKEAITKSDSPNRKNWEIAPNVGPVFYNSLRQGSSIDPSFSDNAQNGETNISYGLSLSYTINRRFSVRSGVNNVRLSYSTGGIEIANSPIALGLSSVDYGNRTEITAVFDSGTLSSLPTGIEDPFTNVTPKNTGLGNPKLVQNIQYYEVPLEINYAFLDKRFSINMIGGFSTLFLGNNEIAIENTGFKEVLGEANNLNPISFSTNIGVGLNYKLSNRLKFNVEPTFKYQINPYSNSSVNFQPYYIGVYSGLSFKF